MEWISNLFDNIKYCFSCLAGVFKVLIFGLALFVASETLSGFFGTKYTKLYPNKESATIAVKEFKKICGNQKPTSKDDGLEYNAFFDSKGEAVNCFMLLARRLNNVYANGKFRHCYLGKERIYQCCDKDKRLIAMQLTRVSADKEWGVEKPFWIIDFYVENKRED